jgi:putative ABC transport system substrate-binding protein
MKRREFIAGLGGLTAARPLAAWAQQPKMPVIGFLHTGSPVNTNARNITSSVAQFREGLKEAGYVEGKNVAIEFRWADLQYAQMPMLANDLVQRQATVIVAAGGIAAVREAKSSTSTIPIVSANGFDLVRYGYAASLNRLAAILLE